MRNLPNALSFSRLVATALVFILVLINQPWAFLAATILFVLASITDFLDGYLARRFKVGSTLGIFLDLTSDKIFVTGILIAMVEIALIPGWIVLVIVTREFLVTGLRSMAAAKGHVIPAGIWGKQKTFITMVAMGLLLLAKGFGAHLLTLFPPHLVFNSQTLQFNELLLLLADILILLATVWTIFSGVEYMIGALPLFQERKEASSGD